MKTSTRPFVPFVFPSKAIGYLFFVLLGVCAAFAALFGACVARADAPPVPAVDFTTGALVAELRILGRELVQRQLPKGAPALPDTHPLLRHAFSAAQIVAEESAFVAPAFRAPFARAAFTMAGYESGWQADPKGSNDLGAAFGALQLHDPQIHYMAGVTGPMLRADLRLGLRAGMVVIARLTAKCGALDAGLTAYATNGTCPKGWTLGTITDRCARAGVNCHLVHLSSTP